MSLQLFGTRKCPDTRKAERFLKERGIRYQFIDLAERGPSPGELRSIAAAAGSALILIDAESAAYAERGLGYMDFDPAEEILRNPLVLKTPILRDGARAAVGGDPERWKALLAGS